MPSLFFNQRLEIYLYLPLTTLFFTLSRLSRSEHLSLLTFRRYQPDMLTGYTQPVHYDHLATVLHLRAPSVPLAAEGEELFGFLRSLS
jgi:hypothetical protein